MKNNPFSEEITKEAIKILIIISIFFIKSKTSSSDANLNLLDLIQDNFIIIITSFIYFTMFYVFKIFKRPVMITIELTNFATGNNSTPLYHYGIEREDISTIVLKVKVKKTNSIWNNIALRLLKNKDIDIHVCSLPENESLICQPTSFTKDTAIDKDGFTISINKIIHSNLENRADLDKGFSFVVKENREYPFQFNQNVPIKVAALINNKPFNILNKMLCNIDYNNGGECHIVEFIK